MQSYRLPKGVPSGFASKLQTPEKVQEEAKPGLLKRVMLSLGLTVDTKKEAKRSHVDHYAKNALDVQSRRGIIGLESGHGKAARPGDEALLTILDSSL